MKTRRKNQVSAVVLTGLSGAGKSIALNAFEDSGFFCVDNLPASLIKTFIHLCNNSRETPKIAVGVDIREKKLVENFSEIITSLKDNADVQIIFLEANDDALIRRFKETRRPHPLGYRDLTLAIRKERKALSDIRGDADRIVDTSSLTPHQLRKLIFQLYPGDKDKPMAVSLISFGYKFGIPTEADLLFDVRFLPNPFFIKELRDLQGNTQKVMNFVLKKQDAKNFLKELFNFLDFLLPRYKTEGRNYLTIGIGCTGGMHRSPPIVEAVRKNLRKRKIEVTVTHRDMSAGG